MTMSGPSISVVMPAFRAGHLLPRVLPPLIELLRKHEVTEVLVVDDCSPDDTAEVARQLGASVIRTPRNGGPGVARNLAAEQATGDILWFVDSDVIAWPDGAEKIRAAFAEPGVKAVFGSYDAEPDGTPWFSRYKNLMHRYYHQRARREATTFWAGCGAVERAFFLKVGGFDVETYRIPSIEDIELGYRIRAAGGRILLIPELLGKHLKVWTIPGAIRTDIYCRALPWSRLMIAREGLTDDLNTSWSERVRALVAGLFALSILLLPFLPTLWPSVPLMAALAVLINLDLARYMLRHGGWLFAVKALIYHQIYYIYSAASFVWCLFEYHVLGQRNKTTG